MDEFAGYGVRVDSGREFLMGTPRHGGDTHDDETRHEVRISRGFWLGKYEVTQGEWGVVMGTNPSDFSDCGPRCPVENVSWEDAQAFIRELNERESGSGYEYRLPTEAEWEYAARAGTSGIRYGELDEIAWYSDNSAEKTHLVRPEGGKRVGPARHAGKRVGVDGGLVWQVSDWSGDRSRGSRVGLVPGASGRRLVLRRGTRSFGGSLLRHARLPPRQHRLPPSQDRVTLGAITLSLLGARGVRASASEGRSESDRAERQNARSGLELSFKRGPRKSGSCWGFRERQFESSLPLGRQRAVGAMLKCLVPSGPAASAIPLRPIPSPWGSVAEKNQKHLVLSGKPVRLVRRAGTGIVVAVECEAQVR